jgi:hypothetical protein
VFAAMFLAVGWLMRAFIGLGGPGDGHRVRDTAGSRLEVPGRRP